MKKEYYIQGLRYLLIVLWIYAAGSKLWFYSTFQLQLSRQPLPVWSIHLLSWAIPAIELITVVLLCFQRTLNRGFLLSFILMLLFTLYVGFGLVHVYAKVPCSCGGILGNMSWGNHFIFNIIFTLIAFAGMYLTNADNKHSIKYNSINA